MISIKDFNKNSSVFIIAEAGVNHNSSVEIAKKLIDLAKDVGADAIKFQSFKTEEIVSTKTGKATYQHRSNESTQYEMLKKLELSFDEFKELKKYCDGKKLEFIITPYDCDSVDFFVGIGVKTFKLASADLINKQLIQKIVETKKDLILSVGMASLGEIERTLKFINTFNNANRITLMHCTTAYPTAYEDVNMNFLTTLKQTFGLPIGYSDHTLGIEISLMAVSYGAKIIEKHFTLDKQMEGPDHFASSEPDEFRSMVQSIRHLEKAFGENQKTITADEKNNMYFMRRSLHASKDIDKNHILQKEDIKIIRPFDGVNPWNLEDVIGQKIKNNLKENDPIRWQDLL